MNYDAISTLISKIGTGKRSAWELKTLVNTGKSLKGFPGVSVPDVYVNRFKTKREAVKVSREAITAYHSGLPLPGAVGKLQERW